ncbi:recombinase family protein [Streptomyces sp. NBC_00400]|uniref:recombinase family protein n=1 Tax=Streptomyces sp. NBC_00400 TaxID=2975737 RepID=UPI002E23298D
MTRKIRAVGAIRLSVLTDETTSPARQREADESAAAILGAEIGDRWAEDLDVSASKTSPFERPELSKWLESPDDYDMVIWWRLDRAVRSMADMHALATWARTHRKMLVFAEGPGGMLKLDFTNPLDPMTEIMVMLLAFAAQMEAQAIRERVTGANAALRSVGRYAGGLPPYGYRPVPREEGEGYTLEPDPDRVEVIETIIRMLVEGSSPNAIAVHLNAEGVPTPRDWNDVRMGRKAKGRKWVSQSVTRVVLSQTLIGHQVHDGVTVRDRKGNPVMITDNPILKREERDAIKALLEARPEGPKGDRKDSNAVLLGVLHCAGCGGRMYRVPAHSYAVYVCRAQARGLVCASAAAIKQEWVEGWVEEEFLSLMGSAPLVRYVEHAGYDPGPELAEVEDELRTLYTTGEGRRSRTGRKVWQEQVDALERRAEALEHAPKTESWTEVIETGQTFAGYWHSLQPIKPKKDPADPRSEEVAEEEALKDPEYAKAVRRMSRERRKLLLQTGTRVECVKGQRGGRPQDMKDRALKRLSIDIGKHQEPDMEVLAGIAWEEDL